ncbi:DUF3347 domain-containing protein [Chryseobacterium koreense]|uniref:DUF3347 domain-containing protein n=1 Tax=Chryseobacterium koreense CCUG 49689 TaxID=1304281 RepID=A0A0J7LMY5_9FLAO|nr:DUF3347 domain-containing protein [Chryseobacterium koreense]KMQ70455.1 hypothetical protein ACM44_12125 [Chryseobacterium koreense CCUG 49689]MBB5334436.1 hypothetical protein [Chryseobacterium koreense]
MKAIILTILAALLFTFTSCSDKKDQVSTTKTTGQEHEMSSMNHAGMPESDVKVIESPKNLKADFTELYSHYQYLTSALASDDDKEAANGANGILQALAKVDKVALSADQAKEYADLEADMKEHAEHIKENIGNIKHQREHLDLLSQDFYEIATKFGTGKTLYKIHCPMYNENKGAYWISTSKEVKNPYYGQEMISCGVVQEEIK